MRSGGRRGADYPCAYCGQKMNHKRQPDIHLAECWECRTKDLIKQRNQWSQVAMRWLIAALLGWGLFAIAAGWLIAIGAST